MTNQQLYLALGIPVFGIFMSLCTTILVVVWQAKGIEKRIDGIDKRLDRIESRLTTIEQDYKVFFQDIARLKSKVGL